jgi:hypothetical protein
MEQQSQPELRVVRTYFIRGTAPKTNKFKPAVRKPPTSGWGIAVILANKKSHTLFSPFTLEAHLIPSGCSELAYARDLVDLVDVDYSAVAEAIKSGWERFSNLGIQRDYGIAASILKMLGTEQPQGLTPGETKAREAAKAGKGGGGKPAAGTMKPLKRGTKRAKVAEFFAESAMIQQAMQELGLTRSGVLSHLHCINKYNGFGYKLTGDSAELIVPEGSHLFEGGE